MKAGSTVNYYDEAGERHPATITEVTGAGPSLYKTLNLEFRTGGETYVTEDTPHENDAAPGDAFWLEKGVARKPLADEQEAVSADAGESDASEETSKRGRGRKGR